MFLIHKKDDIIKANINTINKRLKKGQAVNEGIKLLEKRVKIFKSEIEIKTELEKIIEVLEYVKVFNFKLNRIEFYQSFGVIAGLGVYNLIECDLIKTVKNYLLHEKVLTE